MRIDLRTDSGCPLNISPIELGTFPKKIQFYYQERKSTLMFFLVTYLIQYVNAAFISHLVEIVAYWIIKNKIQQILNSVPFIIVVEHG